MWYGCDLEERALADQMRRNGMGKMNELSILAFDAGFSRTSDLQELSAGCIKELLARLHHSAALKALAAALGLTDFTRGELAAMVCVTKERAMALRHGDILHHVEDRNRDSSPVRVRVSGKCQIWKTRPTEFRLPVKYGLYESGAITHTNRHHWYVA